MDQESIQKIEIDDNIEDMKQDQELLEQLEKIHNETESKAHNSNEKNKDFKKLPEFTQETIHENSIIFLKKLYDDVSILNDDKKKIL
jgi:hypothetical protein